MLKCPSAAALARAAFTAATAASARITSLDLSQYRLMATHALLSVGRPRPRR